jgi:hypothetical protein
VKIFMEQVRLGRALVRKMLIGIFVIALLWVIGCGALYQVMRQPPETFGRFMAKLPGPVPFLFFPFETLWLRARAGHLQVGDPAPDFLLTKLDKSASVQLSNLTAQDRPVVLIFGSYT